MHVVNGEKGENKRGKESFLKYYARHLFLTIHAFYMSCGKGRWALGVRGRGAAGYVVRAVISM